MGNNLTETLITIAISITLLLIVAWGFQRALEGRNQAEVIQGISLMRASIDQLYSGNSYTGLTNDVIINAELAPKSLVRNSELRSPYGPVTVTAISDNQFSVSLEGVTKAGCQQISRTATESWSSVTVNSSEVLNPDSLAIDPSSLTTACGQNRNVVMFTTR